MSNRSIYCKERQGQILTLLDNVERRLNESEPADVQIEQVIGMINKSNGVSLNDLCGSLPDEIRTRMNILLTRTGRNTLEEVEGWVKKADNTQIRENFDRVSRTYRVPNRLI